MSHFTEALATIGGLSAPSAMPSHGWSLPATACNVGSQLRLVENSVCSECYAHKGCYLFASTVEAMARRLAILQQALASPSETQRFVDAFATVLKAKYSHTVDAMRRAVGNAIIGKPYLWPAKDGRYFRWHDSGDVQSWDHLLLIVAIADAVAEVRFWLPTKEAALVRRYLRERGAFPINLAVRVSGPMIDGGPPNIALPTSEVHWMQPARAGAFECLKPFQDGQCLNCRHCWSTDPASSTSYHKG